MLSLTENTLKLSLPLWASEVIFDSEVHFVSEVSPNGEVVGKLNFTFAIAKTSLTEKEITFRLLTDLLSLSLCNKGLDLAHICV